MAVNAPAVSHGTAPATGSASPLTAAYDRLTEVFPTLQVIESAAPLTGEGWITARSLAEGGPAADAFLAWDAAQIERDYGQQGRPDVIASFALHRYAFPLCLLVTVPWFLHRRVPRIPLDAVSYNRDLGRISVRIEDFACLPGDPAGGSAGARTVPGEEALRAEVRAAVAEHMEPVLEGFRPRVRRGARALWGMATDEITEGVWYLGRLLGEEKRAVREAAALLPGRTAPYARGASFRELSGPCGERLQTRDRASCCMYYTLRPEETCVTCPRTRDAERIERLAPTR
ncbi:(2Fe-2S)-binding protein [Streptomyces sp. ODS28]|uniref:(2Fe-2S)-binding protein n=1 Tax=Streptomyces sp. ODS28 TaxID=3136688 RepID=UPI0031E62041